MDVTDATTGRCGRRATCVFGALVLVAAWLQPAAGGAQTASTKPTGRVSLHVSADRRSPNQGQASSDVELSTAIEFESRTVQDETGSDYRFDFRHAGTLDGARPTRVSIYDAYVGGHFGEGVQLRVRAGHMWLQELGTVGSIAGGLVEVGQPLTAEGTRFRVGAFAGREPNPLATGYAPDVRKIGGYAAIESGYLRRHLIGFTQVKQGGLMERSVVSLVNFVPAGQRFFLYQTAELDVKGPAQGVSPSGLAYFLATARFDASRRLELSGTYNKGRSVDARTLTADLLNGRAVTPQAADGLRYESRGGRVTVEVVRNVRMYLSYSQDRTNRDDALTGRVTFGGYVPNVLGSGFDVSASDSLVDRPGGAYHSRYLSVGHDIGRRLYVSGDYSTSLSIIQFVRSDGLVVETRPWSRRYSGSGNMMLTRTVSLLLTADYTVDDAQHDTRLLSGLTYRFR